MNILDRLLEVFSINKTIDSRPSESMKLLKHVRAVRARAFQKITGKKLRVIDSLDSKDKLGKSGRLSLLRRLRH